MSVIRASGNEGKLVVAVLLACVFLFCNIAGIFLTGPYAWDDGAITLAYAKTLSENGVFALTKSSEIVEGTSSILFAAVMAVSHEVFSFEFDEFIAASQVLALISLCLMMGLLYVRMKSAFSSRLDRAVILGLFGTLPMFTAEVLNGMEMSLMAALLAWFVVSFEEKRAGAFVAVPLLLLVRFESVFYLAFAVVALWAVRKEERRRAISLLLYLGPCFLLITAFRLAYFGDYLPNTIWAKMNPPYSFQGSVPYKILSKLEGVMELVRVEGFLLVPMIALAFFRRNVGARVGLEKLLILSFVCFAAITGNNWGYQGRMFLGSLPLILIVFCKLAENTHLQAGWEVSTLSSVGGKRLAGSKQVVFAVLVISLLATHLVNRDLFEKNVKTALTGGYHRQLLPPYLAGLAERSVIDNEKNGADWYGTTPQNYRITGVAVDGIRILLGLPVIKFMAPDVGGLGLCCPDIRVIDSALLTNSFLAKRGYGGFDLYLRQVQPDVIETHGIWSAVSGIYESSFFQESYAPVVFANNLLWVRQEHLGAMLASGKVTKTLISEVNAPHVRYSGPEVDRKYLASRNFAGIWNIEVDF